MSSSNLLYRFYNLIAVALIFFWSGCSDNSSTITQPGESATITGRVTSSSTPGNLAKVTAPVEGAVVTVAQLQSDGSLKIVSKGSAETDVNGEYQVETDASGEGGLFVIAEKDNQRWMARLSAVVEVGQTSRCQPHNDESTTEAEIAREEVEQDQTEDVAYVDIATYVDAEVAAAVKNDAAAILEISEALEAEAQTQAQILTHAEINATQAQVSTANEARMNAQQQLEVNLNQAGENQAMMDAAYQTYYQALVNAYVNTGISASAYAKSKEASSRALLKFSTGVNAQAKLAIKKSAAYLRAWAIDHGCQSGFTAAGASQTQINSVVEAGVNLRTAIRSANSESALTAAFDGYHNSIAEQLKLTLSAQASVISNIDLAINWLGGAKAALGVAVNAAASSNAIVDAYIAFYTAVRTLVNNTAVTATQTEIEAMADVMIFANMHL